jgi:hypothetical protein
MQYRLVYNKKSRAIEVLLKPEEGNESNTKNKT